MRIMVISGIWMKRMLFVGLIVLTINLLAVRALVNDDLENASLTNLSGKCVFLDPGHGGIDSGASANGVVEKEITLKIAGKLADVLQEHGATVSLTRDSDIDYYIKGKGGKRKDLLKRVDMIEQSGADVFISIHCNAIRGLNDMSGAQVFYNPKRPENKTIAEVLQYALSNFPPGNKRQAKEDSRILLLNATNIPGVLVETGYLTNKKEAALLVDAAYQQRLAEQIAKGLAYYFSNHVGK